MLLGVSLKPYFISLIRIILTENEYALRDKIIRTHDDAMTWKCLSHNWPFVRITGAFPQKGSIILSFDVPFAVNLNKLRNKQPRGRCTEMSWRSFNVP